MSSAESIWSLRANMRQEVRSQRQGISITRYLWPSGRSYRILGQDVSDIPQAYLSCCAGLYANRSDAASGQSMIGAAFFVEVPDDASNEPQLYLVTSAEVIRNEDIGDSPVIRIDHKNGRFQLIPSRQRYWLTEDGECLAVLHMETRPLDFSYVPIPRQAFVNCEFLTEHKLAIHDAVFLPETTPCHEGARTKRPSLIFSKVSGFSEVGVEKSKRTSISPEAIEISIGSGRCQPGSPVFLVKPPCDLHFGGLHDRAWNLGPRLLGVYIGQRSHPDVLETMHNAGKKGSGSRCEGMLVPIWKLVAMLNRHGLRERHAENMPPPELHRISRRCCQ